MKTTPGRSRPPRLRAALFALVLAALLAAPVSAAAPTPLPFAASHSLWSPLEWALGSQRRMLQVATVGMCLAIYIILWRK